MSYLHIKNGLCMNAGLMNDTENVKRKRCYIFKKLVQHQLCSNDFNHESNENFFVIFTFQFLNSTKPACFLPHGLECEIFGSGRVSKFLLTSRCSELLWGDFCLQCCLPGRCFLRKLDFHLRSYKGNEHYIQNASRRCSK